MNEIIQGDTYEVLKTLPDESIDCVVTSPPYYGLRDYGTAKWEGGDEGCNHSTWKGRKRPDLPKPPASWGTRDATPTAGDCPRCGAKRIDQQLGLEKTLNEYLDKMLLITGELKRVLKKTGTMWWNHGDNYSQKQVGSGGGWAGENAKNYPNPPAQDRSKFDPRKTEYGIPEKCLALQAHRLIIRMIDEQGWILRNTIIWHKPNCMPSSVKDRFTVDYEPVFFLTKSKKYWFETQYEAQAEGTFERFGNGKADKKMSPKYLNANNTMAQKEYPRKAILPLGRNKRCVWKIPTKPYSEAHFATYPPALIEPMIKAGCPEFICKKCGKAREKISDVSYQDKEGNDVDLENRKDYEYRYDDFGENASGRTIGFYSKIGVSVPRLKRVDKNIRYTDCHCNAGWNAGIVLDPFFGSGTTALVARSLGRNWLGIELNENYIKLAEKRLRQELLF